MGNQEVVLGSWFPSEGLNFFSPPEKFTGWVVADGGTVNSTLAPGPGLSLKVWIKESESETLTPRMDQDQTLTWTRPGPKLDNKVK